jgi:serine/threonine protein kinase
MSSDEADRRDEEIGRILNEYLDRRTSGEGITVEKLISDHPDCADELREHFEAVEDLSVGRESIAEYGFRVPSRGQVPADAIPGYELLNEIDRGGMGVVYRAKQVATGQIVAVKVLLESRFASDKARKRFEFEVETLASLQHPAIVPVYDSGLAHGQYFHVMPYVDGLALDAFVSTREGMLPVADDHGRSAGRAWAQRDTLTLFAAIADALGHAHQHGVIHRDLKPSNILVDADGQPHILDFGLAKNLRRRTDDDTLSVMSVAGQVVGTAAYMSPEQARGAHEETDVRSDVYAIGVMLYQVLTGRHPYPVDGMLTDTLRNIQESDPARPSQLSGTIDPEVDAMVLKALAKEPDRRYQSAAALAEDLRRYLAGEPIEARRDSMLYVLRKTVVRHRRYAAMVLLVCAVVGVFLAWLEIGQWRAAYGESKDLLLDQVLATNLGAAHWVAQGIERELTYAVGMVEQEAAREALRQETLKGNPPSVATFIAQIDAYFAKLEAEGIIEPNQSAPLPPDLFERFPEFVPMQVYLDKLARETANSSFHSWALSTGKGIMLARSVYDAGRGDHVYSWRIINDPFDFRDWFHGGTPESGAIRMTHISEPYVSRAVERYPMVAVSTPVWHPDGREKHPEPIGVLLGTLTLQHFADWLQDVPELPDQRAGESPRIDVVLVNDRSQVVLHPDNPMRQPGDKPEVWRDVDVVQAVIAGEPNVSSTYRDPILNEDVLVGYAPVPVHGWGVLVQRSKAAANAPIQRIASHVGRFGRAAQYIALFVVLFLVIRFAIWIGQRIGRRVGPATRPLV